MLVGSTVRCQRRDDPFCKDCDISWLKGPRYCSEVAWEGLDTEEQGDVTFIRRWQHLLYIYWSRNSLKVTDDR